jgi:peptidoglycan/LPS O-acetylase OafA/YrhL
MFELRDRSSFEGPVQRFFILDSLRGILALIVALGHLGMPPVFRTLEQHGPILHALARFWRTIPFGPPAVIAFFVISGFCIHYPMAGSNKKLPMGRFFVRRYLRIGVPVAAVIAILYLCLPSVQIFGRDSVLWNSTLWSVLCEEIYYAIYPFLLTVSRYLGLGVLLKGSFLLSLILTARTFPVADWSDLGVIDTSIVLLPVWLLGAALAEWARNTREYTSVSCGKWILWWRLGAWGVMWSALVLHFHSEFHQTASAIIVGGFAFLWLRAEFRCRTTPKPFLIWFGSWSYSLYLVHPLVISFIKVTGLDPSVSVIVWVLTMALILTTSYIFYMLVEAPSHALARKISLRLWQ